MGDFIHFANADTASQLSFPGLGLDFSISREAIFIGPLTVYWYGIIVVTGIALGVAYALWRAGKFGINQEKLSDVLLYAIIAGFVGARAYYVIFSWDYYKLHPDEILQVWRGGIAFYGGIIGAVLCGYFLCRRYRLAVLPATDAALGGLLLGQSIGRWGNFVNIEAFGSYFEGPWRMVSPVIDNYFHMRPELLPGFTVEQVMQMTNIPVHPTFFYESAWTMLGFVFMVWYAKHRRFNGELTLLYCFINGLGRSVIEGLRTDSLTAGSLRVSQMLAVCMVVVSAVLWLMARKKIADGSAPAWMVLNASVTHVPDAAVEESVEDNSLSESANSDESVPKSE